MNRPFYPASSVHPASVLIPHPREILILWPQTVTQRKTIWSQNSYEYTRTTVLQYYDTAVDTEGSFCPQAASRWSRWSQVLARPNNFVPSTRFREDGREASKVATGGRDPEQILLARPPWAWRNKRILLTTLRRSSKWSPSAVPPDTLLNNSNETENISDSSRPLKILPGICL